MDFILFVFIEFGQEVAVASSSRLKNPGHDPGFWWLSFSPGDGCSGGCRAGGLLGSDVSFSVC